MSHFAILVITPTEPTMESLTAILQPWHEFECTGTNDQYVQDVDKTEEMRAAYENDENRGSKTFREYVEHETNTSAITEGSKPNLEGDQRYGYHVVDQKGRVIKVVNRTNPNAKWDWWTVGGRWDGFLIPKPGKDGIEGRPGVMGTRSKNDGRSAMRWGDVDVDTMRAKAEERAAADYDLIAGIIAGREFRSWQEINAALPEGERYGDRARKEYNEQDVIKDLSANRDAMRFDGYEKYKKPREQFLAEAREDAIVLFGVVKDGKWYERGDMGWWGCVSDEKDPREWQREFAKLLDDLPADHWVTVVDCHI